MVQPVTRNVQARFVNFYINGERIGAATRVTYTETYGTTRQPEIGSDYKEVVPGEVTGTGSITKFYIKRKALQDILGTDDLRSVIFDIVQGIRELDAQGNEVYSSIVTLKNCYMTSIAWGVDSPTALLGEVGNFSFDRVIR